MLKKKKKFFFSCKRKLTATQRKAFEDFWATVRPAKSTGTSSGSDDKKKDEEKPGFLKNIINKIRGEKDDKDKDKDPSDDQRKTPGS